MFGGARNSYFAAANRRRTEGEKEMGQELWLVVVSVGVLAVLSQLLGWGSGDQSGNRRL